MTIVRLLVQIATTNSLEQNNVRMVQFPQMDDVRLEFLLHFLHGHLLSLVFPHEDSALGPRAQPLQILDGFKWDLPVVLLHLWSFPLPDHHPHGLEATNEAGKPAHVGDETVPIQSISNLRLATV